ncbi:MAG: guanylate kinase [Nitrospirae bacterium]|nr:guanylate kinase [Nitrospirota bacterium]
MNEGPANERQGRLFVVSAPSGAGKTTLCQAVSRGLSGLKHSVSYTTRRPRPGEENGRDYWFIGREEFDGRVRRGAFLEWAEVHGNLYGTSREDVDADLSAGTDVILDIDTQGASQVRKGGLPAVHIFVLAPSLEVLEERLRNRNSEPEEEIHRRLARAIDEIRDLPNYEYVIINIEFDGALDALKSIIRAERCRLLPGDAERRIKNLLK